MPEPTKSPGFAAAVGAQAERRARAKRNAGHGVWFGLGMMGLIGWSVAIPTLLGAALAGIAYRYVGGANPAPVPVVGDS